MTHSALANALALMKVTFLTSYKAPPFSTHSCVFDHTVIILLNNRRRTNTRPWQNYVCSIQAPTIQIATASFAQVLLTSQKSKTKKDGLKYCKRNVVMSLEITCFKHKTLVNHIGGVMVSQFVARSCVRPKTIKIMFLLLRYM